LNAPGRPTGRGDRNGGSPERCAKPALYQGSTMHAGAAEFASSLAPPHSMTGRFPALNLIGTRQGPTPSNGHEEILQSVRAPGYRASPVEASKTREGATGGPGIDGQSLNAFGSDLRWELSCLLSELKGSLPRSTGHARSDSAETGREANGLLGIPTVRAAFLCNKHCVPCWQPIFDR